MMLFNSVSADFFILIHFTMWHCRLYLLLWFWLSNLTSYACICENSRGTQFSSERIREGLTLSQHVFVGEVMSASGNTYRVRPIDIFKGQIKADTLTGFNNLSSSCGLTVTPGIWVFYTTLNHDGTIHELSLCGLSTNLSNPKFASMPPPPSREDKATLDRYYAVVASRMLAEFHKKVVV
ncbi:hypothetical protein [Hymenobacter metallilatus]|uniref:Uncharacterized protein n=1 Tax=Hymenobacter metallilatus TaxID=2493666 RepID=A0A3R9NI25_9BACT|nr:hypothetical protein [Hymenobacter metallilatus]RSK33200.1 hypothetical protein EI290_10830 [Hymenobacter metallilatus]